MGDWTPFRHLPDNPINNQERRLHFYKQLVLRTSHFLRRTSEEPTRKTQGWISELIGFRVMSRFEIRDFRVGHRLLINGYRSISRVVSDTKNLTPF